MRPQLAIVIFDSTVVPGDARRVYMSAIAEELPDAELEEGSRLRRALRGPGAAGLDARGRVAPARHRLYRATASEHFMLGDDRDVRVPVTPSPLAAERARAEGLERLLAGP